MAYYNEYFKKPQLKGARQICIQKFSCIFLFYFFFLDSCGWRNTCFVFFMELHICFFRHDLFFALFFSCFHTVLTTLRIQLWFQALQIHKWLNRVPHDIETFFFVPREILLLIITTVMLHIWKKKKNKTKLLQDTDPFHGRPPYTFFPQ